MVHPFPENANAGGKLPAAKFSSGLGLALVDGPVTSECSVMIMQCPDYDDSDYEFAPAPFGVEGLQSSPPDLPGFLYRGVPQDHRCRTLRIDTVGAQATGVNVTIPGPRWLTALHVSREFTESELFFG